MTRHPAELPLGIAPGFLDFARNDRKLLCGEQTPAHSDLHVPITV